MYIEEPWKIGHNTVSNKMLALSYCSGIFVEMVVDFGSFLCGSGIIHLLFVLTWVQISGNMHCRPIGRLEKVENKN